MNKPKYHPDVPRSKKLIELSRDSKEYEVVSKAIDMHIRFEIESISRVVSQPQWTKYKSQQLKLHQKLKRKPINKIFYHVTKISSAKKIVNNGFNVQVSRLHAFGKGINLCSNFKGLS